jgi:hypothetical protein
MDIFTTALTKIRPNPIKPEKLRVKALNKEPETHELTEDFDHLENHDLYFINEKEQGENKQHSQQEGQQSQSSSKHSEENIHEFTDENIIPSESVITDKQEILHPHKPNDDEHKDIKHLDIFV